MYVFLKQSETVSAIELEKEGTFVEILCGIIKTYLNYFQEIQGVGGGG